MTAGLQPPAVPIFYPGQNTVTQLNSGLNTPSGYSGGLRDTADFMINKPKFRARRVAAQTTSSGHQDISWDTIDVDNYNGWAGVGNPSVYVAKAPGWYLVTARVSLAQGSATGAGLTLIPACAVNGTSSTGIGSNGWEGPAVAVPITAGAPKMVNGCWEVYVNLGDQIQIDMWYSTETPTITSTDTTAGQTPEISLVWAGK